MSGNSFGTILTFLSLGNRRASLSYKLEGQDALRGWQALFGESGVMGLVAILHAEMIPRGICSGCCGVLLLSLAHTSS